MHMQIAKYCTQCTVHSSVYSKILILIKWFRFFTDANSHSHNLILRRMHLLCFTDTPQIGLFNYVTSFLVFPTLLIPTQTVLYRVRHKSFNTL